MVAAKHYLDGEEKVDQIDAMLDGPIEEEIDYSKMHNVELVATYKDKFGADSAKGLTRDELIKGLKSGTVEEEKIEIDDETEFKLPLKHLVDKHVHEADVELSQDQMDKLHKDGVVKVGDDKVMYKVNKEALAKTIKEKLTKKTPMDTYIKDFAKSKAPQFKGKSKEKKREMAVAAKLAKQDK